MSGHFSINRTLGVVFSTFRGRLTPDRMMEHWRVVRKHPDFNPNLDELLEFRDTLLVDFTTANLNLIKTCDPFSLASRRAVVAPDDLTFGISRMYEVLRGGNMHVFRRIDDAREWLRLNR